jgi:hypothetical protein
MATNPSGLGYSPAIPAKFAMLTLVLFRHLSVSEAGDFYSTKLVEIITNRWPSACNF